MAKRGGVRRGRAGCGGVRRGAAWRGEEWRAGAAHLLVGRDDERGAPLLGHVVVQREYLPQEDPSDALDWGVNEGWGWG